MVKQTIQIFGRIKPTKGKTAPYDLSDEDDAAQIISFNVPRDISGGVVNNKKELYKFRFQKLFDQSAKQDEVFEHVAKPVIDNVLQGYNGTIFAYGQTGSGKTFTITGGPERYADRGIIPRTLSYIFSHYQKAPELEFSTHISYLEIYNENGYDLLDPKHEAAKLEDLPKVSLMEDADQNIHLRNLSTHQSGTEEEALNLLFLGDTNRMIAETPMNQASTRSHCIFTVHVTSREPGSATVRRAKLHLVDLAGSERVGKTGVNGMLLTEAKYINLSLHYLEQVIVSLSEKNRQHIPYRNSMMTSVLRDSLGGNCMTTMIATISVEKKNVDESISTCRFAQRVALIKNDAIQNEELDPKLMILRLKKEIQSLKEELTMATGEQRSDALCEEDLERCLDAVKRFLEDVGPDATISIGADMRKIHQCFRILKQRVSEGGGGRGGSRATPTTPGTASSQRERPSSTESGTDSEGVKKLKEVIQQRDNEINILVNMLKKEKKRAADAIAELGRAGRSPPASDHHGDYAHTMATAGGSFASLTNGEREGREAPPGRGGGGGGHGVRGEACRPESAEVESQRHLANEEKTQHKILGDLSLGRQEAFEIFRRDYDHNDVIEEKKRELKQHYAMAKALGETVNQARAKTNKLKASIEQHRMSRVMQGLVDPDDPEPDEMEQEMRRQIEQEKLRYKDSFGRLRHLKTEIEHLQHLLENTKVKLMKDFELWWAQQAASAQQQQEPTKDSGKNKSAWQTPPVTPMKSYSTIPAISASQSSVSSGKSSAISAHRPEVASAGSRGPRAGHEPSDTSGYGSREAGQRSYSQSQLETRAEAAMPLTGDAQADADIMAFMRARQRVLQHSTQQDGR